MSLAVLEFFGADHIVVVEETRGPRSTIREALFNLGVDPRIVYLANSFADAQRYMEEHQSRVIFAGYEVDDHFGLELSLLQKEYLPDPTRRLFGITASEGQGSAVADAAEEEVDFFLIKPFTVDSAQNYITEAVRRKSKPTEYTLAVQSGRSKLASGDLPGAKADLYRALELVPTSATVQYYLGMLSEQSGDTERAQLCYDVGLINSPLHYRCLTRKFMLQYQLHQKGRALETLRILTANYPLGPELLRLAFTIVVASLDSQEVETYYQYYLKQPRKTAALKQTVSEALLKSGKVLIAEGKLGRALDYFKKAAIIAGRPDDILITIIEILIKIDRAKDCRGFLDMFLPSELAEAVIRRAKFHLLIHETDSEDVVAKQGKELVFAGFADEAICDRTIEAAYRIQNKMLVESLANKAITLFPEQRAKYGKHLS